MPTIADSADIPGYIFIQSLPGVGPLNKELDTYYTPIRVYDIANNEFYEFEIKNPSDLAMYKKPILLDDGTLFHGRANQYTDNSGVLIVQEFIIDDNAPVVSGSKLSFAVSFTDSYFATYTSPATYSNAILGKAGTILSPYWYRQTIEFNDTSQHNPYNISFDKSDGYMLHTGYTVQDDSFYCLVPRLQRYHQLKALDDSATPKRGYWSIAYNNGYVSGIGYSDTEYGALLTDWLDVDNDCIVTFADDFFIYRNNAGNFVKVSVTKKPEWRIKLINGLVIVNTATEVNALNTVANGEQAFTYATIYNGDLILNSYLKTYSISVVSNTAFYATEMIAAAINPNYEQNPKQVPSAIFAPVICSNATIATVRVTLRDFETLNYVEVYRSTDNGVLKFWGIASPITGLKPLLRLLDLSYPIDSSGNPLLSPSLFARLIDSGVQKDMFINGGSAYPLQYFDSVTPIYLYYLLSGVVGLQNVFVLQGTVYGVTEDNILLLSYSDGVVSGIDPIAIKKNMRYLGATPYTAYFWSEQNRSIYQFAGDRLLQKLYEANEISKIFTTSYNSATYTLFIATDKGVYAVGDCMYKVEVNTCYRIEQTSTDTVLYYTDADGAEKFVLLRYDSAPGYIRQKLHLRTSFYGSGNNVLSVLDTWYMHFYNNGTAEDGEIKLTLETLTNTGRKTETKIMKVKKSDWDELTNTYYLRYQPQYQRSIGASLDIVSDFAIRDFCVGSQPDTVQIGGGA